MSTPPRAGTDHMFRVRTITAFVHLTPCDFESPSLETKVQKCSDFLVSLQSALMMAGYEVQTLRMATNPFGQFLPISPINENVDNFVRYLEQLDDVLNQYGISLCALGPATNLDEIALCPTIVAHSSRWSCSSEIAANNVPVARATAQCILDISRLDQKQEPNSDSDGHKCNNGRIASVANGMGNFRFCATGSCCSTAQIPFFPAASAVTGTNQPLFSFALGLENGPLAFHWLKQSGSIANIPTIFLDGMAAALQPLEDLCHSSCSLLSDDNNHWTYLGIDTSLNPALDADADAGLLPGSVASALENLDEVSFFGGPGTLAAAAAVTVALQSLPGITKTGYCGFMLPVCEDLRLAELAIANKLRISNLLNISAVCGVGVDTVPIAGDVEPELLTSLLLDVVNLSARWNKPLSCRVFPVPGKRVGDTTEFDSPYLCNCSILSID